MITTNGNEEKVAEKSERASTEKKTNRVLALQMKCNQLEPKKSPKRKVKLEGKIEKFSTQRGTGG